MEDKIIELLTAQNAILLEMLNKMRTTVIVNVSGNNNAVNVVTGKVTGNVTASTEISKEAMPTAAHRHKDSNLQT